MALLESGDEPRLMSWTETVALLQATGPAWRDIFVREAGPECFRQPRWGHTLPRPGRSAARRTCRPDGLWALRTTPESLAILDDIGGAQLIDEPQNGPRLPH